MNLFYGIILHTHFFKLLLSKYLYFSLLLLCSIKIQSTIFHYLKKNYLG